VFAGSAGRRKYADMPCWGPLCMDCELYGLRAGSEWLVDVVNERRVLGDEALYCAATGSEFFEQRNRTAGVRATLEPVEITLLVAAIFMSGTKREICCRCKVEQMFFGETEEGGGRDRNDVIRAHESRAPRGSPRAPHPFYTL